MPSVPSPRARIALLLLLPCTGCRKSAPPDEPAAVSAEPSAAVSVAPPKPTAPAAVASKPNPERHAWLAQPYGMPKPVDTLSARFAVPPEYSRLPVAAGSFGEWLRDLPLAAEGTPVVSFKGEQVRPADDEYLAAVIAIDVGKIDLQQSPDVAIRLHAEWQWSLGNREFSYRGATGLDMPLGRWARGERVMAEGRSVFWVTKGKPQTLDHAEFRRFLDAVFTWANSTSLGQQASPVQPDDVQPGDFFVHAGSPGHAVIILDIAVREDSRKVALLGQALNPAQSVYVLKLGSAGPWFSLRPESILITPYTKEFEWTELRRFPDARPDGGT